MAFIIAPIVAVVSFVVAVIAPVVAFVKANIMVVAAVAAFVASPFIGGLMGAPDMPTGANEAARQQGVLVTTFGSEQGIPVIYGFRKVGGNITFAETGAKNNKYLWVAYVLGEGPIEGIKELYLDDNQLQSNIVADLNLGRTVNINDGKFKGRVTLQLSHGIYFDNARSSTVGTWSICKDAPSWKTSMVYNGLAVVFARYEWFAIETQEDADANPFNGNIPDLKATVLGRKVASINNASNNDYANRTERYSTNPVECLIDYLSNPRYGKGLKRTDFDWPVVEAAANKTKQRVEYISGVYGPILTINHVVDTNQTLLNNTKTMLAGMRAYMPFSQGRYSIKIEDAGNATDILSGVATIVRTFNEDNIVGSITYSTVEKSSKYNAVKVGYVDPDDKWSNQSVVFPEKQSTRQYYLDYDNGRENTLDIFFPTLTNYAMAKDMARLLFNKSRLQEQCSFTADSSALDIEVGDNVYIQSKVLNFSTDPWRVVSINIRNDMNIELGCVKNPDTIYPHTRYGEEDIVLPVYVPRGATIYYPAVQTLIPVGLVPPTNASVGAIYQSPSISSVNPSYFNTPGVNTVVVYGNNFKTGMSAYFVGNNGTNYVSGAVVRISNGQFTIATTASMDAANQPYDVVVVNSAVYGSLGARLDNCLNVDGTLPPTVTNPIDNPPTQDPPITENPDDPSITPPTSTPPPTGEGPNTPPSVPPVLAPLTDVVEITNVQFTITGETAYAKITGIQPLNTTYASLVVYYKRNSSSETVYQKTEITVRPGAGKEINFTLGPLLSNQPYIMIHRVKYASGEFSSRVNKNIFTVSATGAGDPRDYPEQASTGWPVDGGTAVTIRNNNFNKFTATTLTTGGEPRDPREMSFTVGQDINSEAANYDITGVVFYNRTTSPANSPWSRSEYTFSDSYVPGSSVTFNFPGDLGFATYPASPTNAQQQYDFIMRWKYRDGTTSSRQTRVMGANTEVELGSYTINPFYSKFNIKENSADYFITLADPNAPSAARDMTVNILGVGAVANRGADEQSFYIQAPDPSVLSSWAGMRFRSRPVIEGANPVFQEYTETSVYITPSGGNAFYILPTEFEQEREWVVTPMYRSGSQRLDSTKSWYGRGYVANRSTGPDVPNIVLGNNTTNWYGKFNWKAMSTADALNTIDDEFAAPPNPRVQILKYNWYYRPSNTTFGFNDKWCDIEFDHRSVANYVGIDIYRRYRNQAQLDNFYTRQYGNYYGMSRWEKVQYDTVNNSGTQTIRLRPAEAYDIFNSQFNSALPVTTSNSLYLSFVNSYVNNNLFVGTDQNSVEIMIVVRTTSGSSTVGVLLPLSVAGTFPGTAYNQLIGQRPSVVEVAAYSQLPTVLEKNLSQSITASGRTLVYSTRRKSWPNPTDLGLI